MYPKIFTLNLVTHFTHYGLPGNTFYTVWVTTADKGLTWSPFTISSVITTRLISLLVSISLAPILYLRYTTIFIGNVLSK